MLCLSKFIFSPVGYRSTCPAIGIRSVVKYFGSIFCTNKYGIQFDQGIVTLGFCAQIKKGDRKWFRPEASYCGSDFRSLINDCWNLTCTILDKRYHRVWETVITQCLGIDSLLKLIYSPFSMKWFHCFHSFGHLQMIEHPSVGLTTLSQSVRYENAFQT